MYLFKQIIILCVYTCSLRVMRRVGTLCLIYIASLLILVIYVLIQCQFFSSFNLQKYLAQKYRLSFTSLPERLLLRSTLAAAETHQFAVELLPFERRQP